MLDALAVASSIPIVRTRSDRDGDEAATSNRPAANPSVMMATAQVTVTSDVDVQTVQATHAASPMGAALRIMATPRKMTPARIRKTAKVSTPTVAMLTAFGRRAKHSAGDRTPDAADHSRCHGSPITSVEAVWRIA